MQSFFRKTYKYLSISYFFIALLIFPAPWVERYLDTLKATNNEYTFFEILTVIYYMVAVLEMWASAIILSIQGLLFIVSGFMAIFKVISGRNFSLEIGIFGLHLLAGVLAYFWFVYFSGFFEKPEGFLQLNAAHKIFIALVAATLINYLLWVLHVRLASKNNFFE